jgi:tetratricopeptide (TPR) repeat protein
MALDVVALETLRGDVPKKGEPQELYDQALSLFNAGDIGRSLGCLYALRQAVAGKPELSALRQKAQMHFAIVAGNLGRFNLSKSLVEQLLREPLPRPMLLRAFVQLARAWEKLGVQELALAMLARAEAFAKDAGPGEAAWVSHQRAITELARGQYLPAKDYLAAARKLYKAAGNQDGVLKADVTLVRLHLLQGEAKQALKVAQQVARLAAGRKGRGPETTVLLGHAQLASRLVDEAISTLRTALGEAVTEDSPSARYLAHHYLAKAYLEAGDRGRAAAEQNAADQFRKFVDYTPDPVVFEGGQADAVTADRLPPRQRRPRRGASPR